MARGQDYVRAKAREALEATGGSRHEAALLLRVWAEADSRLYRAMTGPLLGNLSALAIQRESSDASIGVRKRRRRNENPEADLLAAIGSKTSQTMASSRSAVAPPRQGSARHKQAVTLLASAYRRKPVS